MPNWKAALEALFKKDNEDKISKIINNIILDKISNIEIKIKDKDEDLKEHIKSLKSLINFNRKDIDELIQIIQSHYEETKKNSEKIEINEEENEDKINNILEIIEIHFKEVEEENNNTKKLTERATKIFIDFAKNQKNENDFLRSNMENLEKQNEIMKQQIEVLYKMVKVKQ